MVLSSMGAGTPPHPHPPLHEVFINATLYIMRVGCKEKKLWAGVGQPKPNAMARQSIQWCVQIGQANDRETRGRMEQWFGLRKSFRDTAPIMGGSRTESWECSSGLFSEDLRSDLYSATKSLSCFLICKLDSLRDTCQQWQERDQVSRSTFSKQV